MNKQPEYMQRFTNESDADRRMHMKNRANRMPGWIFVLVDGPGCDWFVMDIRTAIEGGFGYRWA